MSGHLVINLESVFGLAAVIFLLWRAEPGPALDVRPRLRIEAADTLPMGLIALMIGIAYWRAAQISFLSDDYILVSMAQTVPANYRAMFTHGGGDGFFRPLGYLSLMWTWPWAGLDPIRWHWAGLLLHLGNSLLVYVLAGAIGLSRGWSWLASAVFAWYGANPEAVLWIAGRFDLLATFFGLLALVAFVHLWEIHLWEEASLGWGFAAGGALALALLSKESAYAIPLAMAVYVIFRAGTWSRRVRYLAPFFLVAAVLFLYRWTLQGGIGGYLAPGGQPQALSLNPVSIIEALGLRLWAILFFPVNWATNAGVGLGVATALYVIAWVAMIWAFKGNRARVLIPLGFVLTMALPPVQQLLIGADLEKSRLVYLPAAGFCLLVASVGSMSGTRLGWGAALMILAFNLTALTHNLSGWESVAAKAKRVCEAVSECSNPASVKGLPRSLNGVYFFANGLPECARIARAQNSERPLHACSLAWDAATDELKNR